MYIANKHIAAHGELDTMLFSKYMVIDQLTTVLTFILSHSADVIAFNIRFTNSTSDVLNSINVLLDKLPYSILNAAQSLTPS
jgi:hypothetical protein